MIRLKETYVYTDNFGKKHKMRISPDDISCVPYATADTGIYPLQHSSLPDGISGVFQYG